MIMANLPTHLHHSCAMQLLMGGILMSGERRGDGGDGPWYVCVFVCVERPRKILSDLKKVNASWSLYQGRLAKVNLLIT